MSKLQSVNFPPENHVKVLGDQGWVGLVNHMGDETTVVNAARVSMGKMREEMDEKDVVLLKYLIDNNHNTPLEHVVFTFLIHCPLFVRSQWHRHRTWSFNEISRRYTEEDLEFYVPNKLRAQAETNRQASVEKEIPNEVNIIKSISDANSLSLSNYHALLYMGVCREQARGVLSQNLMTTYWGTVDLHNLIGFLELRDSEHAQYEIRVYAQAIKTLITPYIPNVAKILNF